MKKDKYLYMKIYNEIIGRIANGSYKVGDKLPTEKELSEGYGVSRITSQKVMNMLTDEELIVRHPGIGTFVAEKVDVALKKVSKNEIIKHTKVIGLVVEAIWQSFGIGIFDAVYEKAKQLGYTLVIKKSYGSQEEEIKAIYELIEMGAEGILIMPVHGDYYSEEILKLALEKFPIVFMDRYLNGIHVPFVGANNIEASKIALKHLIKYGHKHIALITAGENEATTLDERRAGYIDGCIEYGLDIKIYDKASCIIPHAYDTINIDDILLDIQNFLEEHEEITAVIATEYFLGTVVKKVAINMGKKVPKGFNIVCFDAPFEHIGDYELTHIRQDEKKIGEEAVMLLDKIIKGESVEKDKILIDTSLQKGNSTDSYK